MKDFNLPHEMIDEIASIMLNKAKYNIYLSKEELAYELRMSKKSVERIDELEFTCSNGKNSYNINDILKILDNNYTGKNNLKSMINQRVKELLQIYTNCLIKKIILNNPSLNLKSPDYWILQEHLIHLGISERKLRSLRKTGKLHYSILLSHYYYKLTDIHDCFTDLMNDNIDTLIKNSLFYKLIIKDS